MIEKNQAERLAAMANALRPDWPVASLMTVLSHHRDRPYRDLAVALAWTAADPATATPGRLAEAGPWWTAAAADIPGPAPATTTPSKCPRCGGFWRTPDGSCIECELINQRAAPPSDTPPAHVSRAEARQAVRK